MGISGETHYIDRLKVKEELRFANFIFSKGGFTIINVNNKPIETTANEIIAMLSDRFGHGERKLNRPEY